MMVKSNQYGYKLKRSEFNWYSPLRRYLEHQRYTTWQELKISFGDGTHMELDIVGMWKSMRGIRLASIEVKETDVSKVVSQAAVRRLVFDYCYIALPLRRRAGYLAYIIYKLAQNFEFLHKEGIGILLYDETSGRVLEPFNARKSKVIHQSLRNKLLETLQKLEIDNAKESSGSS